MFPFLIMFHLNQKARWVPMTICQSHRQRIIPREPLVRAVRVLVRRTQLKLRSQSAKMSHGEDEKFLTIPSSREPPMNFVT
jgi:hypothetical protein